MEQQKPGYSAPPPVEVHLVDPEIVRQIRGLSKLGWGAKRIARELDVARNTVRRYIREPDIQPGSQSRPNRRRLDPDAVREAEELLQGAASGNAVVVHRMLAAKDVKSSLRTIQRAVSRLRRTERAAQVASVRFETGPGEQLQIDFGEKRLVVGGREITVHFFVGVLGYSRRIFVQAFLSERQDDWREGLATCFRHFGGVPKCILIDNPKAMVLHHNLQTRHVELNPAFEAFCRDWDVAVRACAPYRARTKGKTESGVKYVKGNALAGLSFVSMTALDAHLHSWMELADARVHGTTHEQPIARFEAECEALRPLPARPTPVRERRLRRRVANDSLVNVDTIRYSVPHRFVRDWVEVHVGSDEVKIYAGSECVATHRRCHEPHRSVTLPEHYAGLVKRDLSEPDRTALHSDLAAMGRSLQDYADVIGGAR
jgi:transposase